MIFSKRSSPFCCSILEIGSFPNPDHLKSWKNFTKEVIHYREVEDTEARHGLPRSAAHMTLRNPTPEVHALLLSEGWEQLHVFKSRHDRFPVVMYGFTFAPYESKK